VHRAGRDDPDQPVVAAQREGDVQETSGIGPAQGVQPRFAPAMACILDDQERLVEENLLCLGLTDAVLVNALAAIALVPVEPLDAAPIDQLCILP